MPAVQVQGSPQLKEAVDREEVAISDAAQVARHQLPEHQTEALERVRSGEASTLQKAVAKARAESPTRDPQGLPIPDDLAAAFRALPQFKTAKAMPEPDTYLLNMVKNITSSVWTSLASSRNARVTAAMRKPGGPSEPLGRRKGWSAERYGR